MGSTACTRGVWFACHECSRLRATSKMSELTRMPGLKASHGGMLSSARALPKMPITFLIHQTLAAWGAIVAAPMVLVFFGEVAWHLGWKTYVSQAQELLYGTPYFPAQTSLALVVGWVLGGTLQP